MPSRIQSSSKCSGQTLIETLVAVFMLVMGISAAVGLAIYALNTSTNISKQIIATGLAREGIEAVKEMRDTNWLQQGSANINSNCYDYSTGQSNAFCYLNWLTQTFCLYPKNNQGNGQGSCNSNTASSTYYLTFDPSLTNNPTFWYMNVQNGNGNGNNTSNYGLVFDPTDAQGDGFYYSVPGNNGNQGVPCANGVSLNGNGISDFCRKITITQLADPPYNQNEGPLLYVQSQVWWVDKKCPRVPDYAQANPSCQVEMDMYLTNWKNY